MSLGETELFMLNSRQTFLTIEAKVSDKLQRRTFIFLSALLNALCRQFYPLEPVLECTAATLRGKKSKIGEVLCEVRR